MKIKIGGVVRGLDIEKTCEVKRFNPETGIYVIRWNGVSASFDGETVYNQNTTMAKHCYLIKS